VLRRRTLFFKVSQTSCLAVAFLSAVALAKEEA
jgi:hypothetical protein